MIGVSYSGPDRGEGEVGWSMVGWGYPVLVLTRSGAGHAQGGMVPCPGPGGRVAGQG